MRLDRCQACGLCTAICPRGCLAFLDDAGALVEAGACTSEEHCVSACPEGAIHMTWARVDGDRSVGRWRSRGSASAWSRRLVTAARSR
ncbi:MAG: hypothetical protein LAP39_23145 [Acidobacteriia bacterium]|nr:hypothetical protein [Terriglobia bacterium]